MKLIFCLLIPFAMLSQHTPRCLEFMNKHSPTDSIMVVKNFKNGNPKETGKEYTYESSAFIYTVFVGEKISYYKTGEVLSKTTYDDFGIQLSCVYYCEDGHIIQENRTQKIDTSTKSLDDFFGAYNFDIVTYSKDYSYSKKFSQHYLKKEGAYVNFRRSGIWKTYNSDGSIKKEKFY